MNSKTCYGVLCGRKLRTHLSRGKVCMSHIVLHEISSCLKRIVLLSERPDWKFKPEIGLFQKVFNKLQKRPVVEREDGKEGCMLNGHMEVNKVSRVSFVFLLCRVFFLCRFHFSGKTQRESILDIARQVMF